MVERVPADRAIVLRFVEHLRDDGRPGLKVECWPEDENPGQSEIEAIAGDLAIEHTSIDTLPQQRRIGDHFEEALAILERLPVSARLAINVPYEPRRRSFRATRPRGIRRCSSWRPKTLH